MLPNAINVFIREHFLHWLEVLSLIGKVSDGSETMAHLRNLFVSVLKTPASRGL
jgi:hypothetical protein